MYEPDIQSADCSVAIVSGFGITIFFASSFPLTTSPLITTDNYSPRFIHL